MTEGIKLPKCLFHWHLKGAGALLQEPKSRCYFSLVYIFQSFSCNWEFQPLRCVLYLRNETSLEEIIFFPTARIKFAPTERAVHKVVCRFAHEKFNNSGTLSFKFANSEFFSISAERIMRQLCKL